MENLFVELYLLIIDVYLLLYLWSETEQKDWNGKRDGNICKANFSASKKINKFVKNL